MADDRPTFRALITQFTDFLTVTIHTILYERSIYPETSFLSARKYNFAVRQNRHPKVCEWVNDAVVAVENELVKGTVARVAVVIYNKQNKPLERFVFDTSRFPSVPRGELDTPLEQSDDSGEKTAVLPMVDMEEQFRATLSKVTNCGSSLQPIPSGCTFTVAIELKEDGEAPIGHPQPWMPLEPQMRDQCANAIHSGGQKTTTTPLRAVQAGDLVFETWIEESKTKALDNVNSG